MGTGTTMKMPALAVVGPDHRIVRSTETFRRRYAVADGECESSPEVALVLTGQADAAVLNVGELSFAVEAVTDAAGKRQAMLSLAPEDATVEPEPPVAALSEAIDQSPAIVWVKDLEGRYLHVNARYTTDLETSEERLHGHTDAELPPRETVDGPRLRFAEDGLKEPLQLEYTVPAFEGRGALVALRFALRDASGQPIGSCGVAAPVAEARLAREEAVRLMQLERWNRLDPADVRAELLEQWHVQKAPPRATDTDGNAPHLQPAAEAQAEVETLPQVSDEDERSGRVPHNDGRRARDIETNRRPLEPDPEPPAPAVKEPTAPLQADLALAREWAERATQLQSDLQQANARVRESDAELQQSYAAVQRAKDEASRWRGELEHTRSELEHAQAEAHAARAELEAARGELGAARAQAESLRAPSGVALRLSEELGRALAAERERGDELARTLARIRARLTDLDSALEQHQAAPPHPF